MYTDILYAYYVIYLNFKCDVRASVNMHIFAHNHLYAFAHMMAIFDRYRVEICFEIFFRYLRCVRIDILSKGRT